MSWWPSTSTGPWSACAKGDDGAGRSWAPYPVPPDARSWEHARIRNHALPPVIRSSTRRRNPEDISANLYDQPIVDLVNALTLPRYGLGNYVRAFTRSTIG